MTAKEVKYQVWKALSKGKEVSHPDWEKVAVEMNKMYQMWFDVAFRVYSMALEIENNQEQKRFIDKYICRDIVRSLLKGKDYSKVIWKQIKTEI